MEAVKDISDDLDYGYDVSHERYIELQTGKNAGKTPEEKVDHLAKCLAAYTLKKTGQKQVQTCPGSAGAHTVIFFRIL